ncbi:MAG: DNA translocase FtsK 4TM domain-containing protein [Flavobacteriales bacterium]|nr:DNA translocase FtsK 4TM domain-containing protein [Flavobacteriales bacterium]
MAKSTKSKTTSKKNSSAIGSSWKEHLMLKDQRTRKIVGGLICLFSVFMLLSFVSFLFTWKSDESAIMNGAEYFEKYPEAFKNWMRQLGAKLSFELMHRGFGLSAFSLPFLTAVIGLRIYSNSKSFNIYVALKYTLFIVIFFSLLFALVFHNSYPVLAGLFGIQLFNWLESLTGVIGVVLFLLFFLASILIWNFNIDLFQLIGVAGKKAMNVRLKRGGKSGSAEDDEDDIDLNIPTETLFEKDKINVPEKEENVVRDLPVTPAEPVKKPEPVAEKSNDLDLEINRTVEEEIVEEPVVKPIEHQGLDTEYDPRLDLSSFKFPEIQFLNEYADSKTEVSEDDLKRSKDLIVETLKNYKIEVSQIKATIGPTVTLFEIVPAPGIKISKIKNLEDDIALSLAALGIRIIAPIPGKGTIGIEVPNKTPEIVSMRSNILSKKYQQSKFDLPVCLGKTISNEVYVADLAKMPHLLMAGATGQGKSVGLNALLVSLLYKKHPAELKLVLVDPKKVELTLYNRIERHYLAKIPGDADAIITDNKQVIRTLTSLCVEMDNRYALLQDALVRNIKEYNAKFLKRKLNPNEGHRFLPYIVVVIDEVADLIMTAGKEVEHPIARLAQLARAIGIHLVLATQRPSVNIITGTIKANFPARVAFRVSSKIDSRTILDGNGADQLIGKGDMLYSTGSDIIRLQCPFVDTPEVETITSFVGEQRGYPSAYLLPEVQEDSSGSSTEELDADERDALFEDAARIVVQHQQGSTSLLQRRLKIGYNRAGRLIDQLERANIVGPFEGSKARQVLMADEYALEQYLNDLD